VGASATADGAAWQTAIKLDITLNQGLLMSITLSWLDFSGKPCQHMTIKPE
jgi:hypothetical protein